MKRVSSVECEGVRGVRGEGRGYRGYAVQLAVSTESYLVDLASWKTWLLFAILLPLHEGHKRYSHCWLTVYADVIKHSHMMINSDTCKTLYQLFLQEF